MFNKILFFTAVIIVGISGGRITWAGMMRLAWDVIPS
jgi:hypothetical protein